MFHRSTYIRNSKNPICSIQYKRKSYPRNPLKKTTILSEIIQRTVRLWITVIGRTTPGYERRNLDSIFRIMRITLVDKSALRTRFAQVYIKTLCSRQTFQQNTCFVRTMRIRRSCYVGRTYYWKGNADSFRRQSCGQYRLDNRNLVTAVIVRLISTSSFVLFLSFFPYPRGSSSLSRKIVANGERWCARGEQLAPSFVSRRKKELNVLTG